MRSGRPEHRANKGKFQRAGCVISVTAGDGSPPYIRGMAATRKNDRNAWIQGPPAQCGVIPQASGFPWRLVLLGAPGVGKGTQADLLNQQLHACHLSTGDVFRASSKDSEGGQTPAIREALAYMRRGELVPDSTVWEMVRERSGCLQCAGGFILDGFPRTLPQAALLHQLMESEGLPLTAVVNYQLPPHEIVKRLGGRRTCEKCKAVFHVTERPPKVADRCDQCNGKLFQREDDRPESVTVRLEAYEQSTAPLIAFYRNLGLLVEIAATGSPEEICANTITSLQTRRIVNVGYDLLREF